jgi:hypothetical protein
MLEVEAVLPMEFYATLQHLLPRLSQQLP